MFSVILFGISLVGLIALFSCKAVELTRGTRTPLERLRRAGDPFLTEKWTHYRAHYRDRAQETFSAGVLWLRSFAQKSHSTFDTTMHALAMRLNRYLRGRRTQIRQNGAVSAHLKTVLEKTEESATTTE